MDYYVHPTAVVDKETTIGNGTKVWHFSHIMNHSKIGKNCVLGQNVFVAKNISIGDNVKIQNNVSIYEGMEIESDVFIGPSAVFTNIKNPRSFINRKSEFKKTILKKGVSIGANATIICGITIHKYAFIAAGSVVTKDVNPFELIMGVPGKRIGWVSRAGERLHFENNIGVCPISSEKYILKNDKVDIL